MVSRPPKMFVNRWRSDQDDARIVGNDPGMLDNLLQVGLVLIQRDVLLIGSTWKGGIIGAEEDGLDLLIKANRLHWLIILENKSWPGLEKV